MFPGVWTPHPSSQASQQELPGRSCHLLLPGMGSPISGFSTGAGIQELLSWPCAWHISILLSRGSSGIWEPRLLRGMLGQCRGHHPCSGLASEHTQGWHPDPPVPADPDARIGSSSAPAPALIPDTWNASSWGPQTCWESPEKGAEPGELFSRSHFIIVAKETSSQDLAWNMSASAGPHIHLSQSALRAGAGADKGGDGGGGCSGTTAAALNRPARTEKLSGIIQDKTKKIPNGIWNLLQ